MSRPLHIGIVACSAEGAALCYRTICAEAATLLGPHAHPEVTLHGASLADYVRCLDKGDLQGVADLMLSSARKLAAAGADFLICPDNTIHRAFEYVAAASPLPWLHIAEVVAAEAVVCGYRRLGLIGTQWLVASEVYPEKLALSGLECVRPSDAERDQISRLIMDELVYGTFRPQTVAYPAGFGFRYSVLLHLFLSLRRMVAGAVAWHCAARSDCLAAGQRGALRYAGLRRRSRA